ncbi:MAG: hypothetical protein FWG39_04085, partial [Alphaproteobacteria bacterium]|nr:hypothetical protein [Alphaproteobacteria bacterium]
MAEFNFRNLVNWGKMAVLTATVVGAVVVCSLFSACDKKPTEPERPPVVSDTLRYDISSVKDLYQQRPDIAAALAKDNTFVVVDVASLRMTSPGLDSLMTGTSGLIGRDNIEWNWTDILAAAQGVLLRYENQWLKLQEPPLAANPEKWTVTESDLPKFQAKGYGNAVELAPAVTDTLRYDIDSVDGFLGLLSEISEAAAGGNNFVIINFESLGISGAQSRQSGGVRGALAAGVNAIKNARGRSFSENVKAAHGAVKNRGRTKTGGESQLDALADGVDELRAKPNVKLNWANIYPTERGMLISHDGHWVRLDMPALLANPYPWSANAADLELFQAAGQGAAIELVAETITFDINSAAAFLNQLDAMNDAANQQNASVVINVSSIGVAANQLTPLTAGVDGIRNRPNVNLTWADIYPTVRGILFSYEGNWILLQNPPLRANPHKWEVTEQDLALFQNAGYGNAVEVADPEIIIVPFNISSAQDFL